MPRIRILAGALALAISGGAAAAQFDNVIVFGDSLTDNGNLSYYEGLPFAPTRFTTNPGLESVEWLAQHYGITLNPSILGGTDYAYGGAGLINNAPGTPPGVPTLPMQLQTYLAANGGKADPNALYSVWGGANDVFYNVYLYQTGSITQTQLQTNLQTAAQTELGLIAQLGQSGAQRVIVFNLPDIGQTPESLAQGPTASAQGTGLSIIYNSTLNAGLAQTGVDIIPVDTFGLLHEIIADPARYGFTNVTDAACGLTSSSLACGPQGSGLPYTYAPGTDQTYLFADGVHPTSGAQAMLGEYLISELAAPGQTSLLAEAPLQVNDTLTRTLRNQAMADFGTAPDGSPRGFADYEYSQQKFDATDNTPQATTNFNSLTLGGNLRTSDHLSLGLATTLAHGSDGVYGGGGGFKLDEMLSAAYVMYDWQQGGYLGAIGSAGTLRFHDIQRNIVLGPAIRSEGGSTSGSHIGLSLVGGWLFGSDNLRTGPYADLGYQRVRVSGYAETGGDSTAMTFDRQEREAMVATLGWQLIGNWQAGSTMLHPYAQLAWNHDSKAEERDVRAGLVNMPGTFAMPGFTPDKDWGNVGLGLSADLTPAFSLWASYDGRFSDADQRSNSVNLGGKLRF
ncbi:MAG: autotransporter domain-containing protein [Proteobacteria bacterium]|nr:autotransporter domain-containing protein [Pseudomonadota bacterium]